MPLPPKRSVKSKQAEADGVVALWAIKLQFMENIPVLLCSQSLKLHKGLYYPKLS